MARAKGDDDGLAPGWWTLILLVLVIAAIWLTYALFTGALEKFVPVTLTSDRSGLVMESNAKVKLRGVQVGRVAAVEGGSEPVKLKLEIYPDQIEHIPANVEAQIRATTVFGAKFVDLVYPSDPSPQRLKAGQVLRSRNVAVEVNTVFENVVGVLDQIDPAKLNSVLSALAEGVRGKGDRIGEATTDANQVLLALNPRSETVRADWQALRDFSDTYSVAAQDILTTLNAASTTSVTLTKHADALDALLLGTIGLSNSGISLLAPSQANLIKAINVLEPTTNLLYKYNPVYTCLLVGAKYLLDHGGYESPGGNGRSIVLDAGSCSRRRHVPLPAEPARRRRQGRSRRQAELRVAAHCQKQLAGASAHHEHRLRNRSGLAPQLGYRLPRLRQLPAVDSRGARAAEYPQPVRRACARTDSVPGRSRLRRGPCTPRTARRCGRDCRPRLRQERRGIRVRRRDRSRSWWLRRRNNNRHRCRRFRYRSSRRHRRDRTDRTDTTTEKGKPTMTANWRSAAVRLGIFLAVCLVGVFALYAVFGQLRFGEKANTYKAEFLNVTGLENGDFVRIAGVEVGQVKDVSIQGDTTALVEFTANDSVVLTDGNRAVIRYDDLIGGRYLALVEGAGGTAKVNPGDTIPLARTSPALDLDALIGGFRPLFSALDPDQVNALSGQLIQAFEGQGATIGSFLTQTAALTNTLADRDQLIGDVIVNLNTVLGSLGGQSDQFSKAVDSLSELVKGLAARKTDISNGVAYANAAAGSIADLLAEARPPFAKTIQETDRAAGIVVADHDYFDNLINTLPDAYQALNRQGLYGDFFSFYLCDLILKLNGKGGQPVYVKVAGQPTGRCAPR